MLTTVRLLSGAAVCRGPQSRPSKLLDLFFCDSVSREVWFVRIHHSSTLISILVFASYPVLLFRSNILLNHVPHYCKCDRINSEEGCQISSPLPGPFASCSWPCLGQYETSPPGLQPDGKPQGAKWQRTDIKHRESMVEGRESMGNIGIHKSIEKHRE